MDLKETGKKLKPFAPVLSVAVVANVDFKIDGTNKVFTVFTTRCDTLFGATYCVMAPEHPYVEKITTEAQKADVEAYKESCASKSDLERSLAG